LNLFPFVSRPEIIRWQIGNPEEVRAAKFGVSCSTTLRNFDESERLSLAQGGPDCVTMDAVTLEVVMRDG